MKSSNLYKHALLCLASASAISTSALAQEGGDGEIVIVGRRLSQADQAIGVGETANTVAVTREALLSAPAGISGLKMLEQLPGFNVQTDGALGLYEFGNSVTVRAFNLQQIGFVLDGIPMGRSDAFGGSPIFRYVDNENLGAVVASPGAGDVSQPSYASLGPIVEYLSVDPNAEFGATVSQAWGDFDLNRSFIKINTGEIGGFSAYVSRSKTDSDLWRGGGYIDREHWEAKALYEWDEDTRLTFRYVSNDFFDYDSPTMTKSQYDSGALCANGEGGRYCGYSETLPPGTLGNVADYNVPGYTYAAVTGWYLDRVNIRQDSLYGATFESAVTDIFDVTATAYYEDKDGYGVSPDSYSNSRGIYVRQAALGLPVTAPRGVQYGLSGVGGVRKGLVLSGDLELANHTLTAGVWFEDEDYHRTQLRLNHEGGLQAGAVLYDEVAYLRRDYTSVRETTQLFLKDTISLLNDALTLELGVKALSIDYELSGYRDFADYELYGAQTVSAKYEEMFLPMVGAVYELTDSSQVFASYAQNFALPRGADDIFSIATNPANNVPAPEGEESENFEIGLRTLGATFDGAIALFYTSFDNRLETFANQVPGQTGGIETFSQNVGEVTSYGVELTGAWKPEIFNDLIYFNGNLTYNKAQFEDDIPTATPIRISGNTLADSPELVVTAGVTVEPTPWIVANLSARYVSERYSNFINTEKVDGFTVVSGYVDIGDGSGDGPLGALKARINVDNIFDEDALSFISPSVSGPAFFRPQSPRTVSFSVTAEF